MSSDDKEPETGKIVRKETRRRVAIDVKLRRAGEGWFNSRITDLSESGFCIDSFVTLERETPLWIMFPGFEGRRAKVVWVQGHSAGCVFDTPLYPAVLDHIISKSCR